MSDAEQRLAELWKTTDAPPRDLAFALLVEERVARRLMVIDVAGRFGIGLVAIAALLLFGPALLERAGDFVGSLDAAGPVLAAVAVLSAITIRLARPADDGLLDAEDGGAQP
jgi:hypothetical protein